MKKFNTKDVIKSIEYNIWIQALILNLIAFAISQFFFEPVFETNDDNYISAILYGVYGEYDTHLVYMNVIMGKIIKLLLLLCPILPWYTIIQYILLFVAFTAILYLILNNKTNEYRYFLCITMLIFFGYECYVKVQYSKTAGVMTAAGILLVYEALKRKQIKMQQLILGACLMVIGSLYRFQVFIMMLAIIGIMVLFHCINEMKNKDLQIFRRCCVIFLPIFIVCFCFKLYDSKIYNESIEWKEYKEFDKKRIELLDYGFPDYNENRDIYQELDITKADLELYKNWNFADKELFTEDVLEQLADAKREKTFDLQTIKSFFSEIPVRFLAYPCFWVVCTVFIMWILGNRNNKLSIVGTLIISVIIEIYFYYTGRYFINRVDLPVLLGIFIILAMNLEKGHCHNVDRYLACIVFAAIIFNDDSFLCTKTKLDGKESAKEIMQLIENDKDNIYFVENYTSDKLWTSAHAIWEMPRKGCSKNYYPLGGWRYNTPLTNYQMQCFKLNNPYRDIVADNVYLISDSRYYLNLIEQYLKNHYYPDIKVILEKKIDDYCIFKCYKSEINIKFDSPDVFTSDIKYKYSVSTDKNGERILQGFAYKNNQNSFKQKMYVSKYDKEEKKEIIYPVALSKKSKNEKVSKGKYSWFEITLNELDIDFNEIENEKIKLYLETDDKIYVKELKFNK
ncbi:MAG: hypothetical protein ACLRTF_09270 [Blautia sp.]